MRAALLYGPRDVRVQEVEEPRLLPGTVAIDVAWCGICGSDLALYTYAPVPHEFVHPLLGEEGPHVLGHEFSGHVTAVGDGVRGTEVGQLVAVQPNVSDGTCAACRRGEPNICESNGFLGINGGGGGFSERVVVDAEKVFVLPAAFTPKTGALVEFLSVAWRAVRQSGITPQGTAFVVGAGPIGLALTMVLRARGVRDVVVSELGERRKHLAAELGAVVVDPQDADVVEFVRERTGGSGVDVSFDASGIGAATFSTAVAALRTGGTTVVVANFHDAVPLDLGDVMQREIRLVGSLAYNRIDFEEVIAAVSAGDLDPTPLISSEIGLEDLVEHGLEHLTTGSGRQTEVKILVRPTTTTTKENA